MKKHILLGAICMMAFIGAKAQQNNTTPVEGKQQGQHLTIEQKVNKQTEKAASELNLTADQKEKWAAASLERIKNNEPLKQQMQGSTTPEQRKNLHQQMRANNQKFNQAVIAFLTPEQKTKFEAMKKNRPNKGLHGQHRPRKVDTATMPNDINKN